MLSTLAPAWAVAMVGVFWAAGCRPAPTGKVTAEPQAPVALPPPRAVAGAPTGHTRLVGVMCLRGAVGRPALAALAERQPRSWVGDSPTLRRSLGALRTPELAVLAFDGHRSGWFTPAGLTEAPMAPSVSVGSYAGALPCADEATATECQAVERGCGVAIGSPESEDPMPLSVGGCVVGKNIIIDTDGDGKPEAFDIAELARLGEEIVGKPAQESCPARFAFAAGHDLDVLAVTDIDGDGRVEVILSRRGDPTRRIALYTAENAFRLTRVGLVDLR